MIKLLEVIYDRRARDGTWCRLPYPGHSKGCPNFPRCPSDRIDFLDLSKDFVWFAVIEEFNLAFHEAKMRAAHPNWTEKQCRNLLYWQPKVKAALRQKAYPDYPNRPSDRIVLEIPEASGVNVFETMEVVGIKIDRHPNIVRKVMLIGKANP